MRRAIAVLAVAVVAASATSAYAARPKPLPRCVSFRDDKADDAAVDSATRPATADPSLDIAGVTYSVVGDSFVGRIAVDRLGTEPAKSWGARYSISFDFEGKRVGVYVSRTRTQTGSVEGDTWYQQGIVVDDEFVPGSETTVTGTIDTARNTVSIGVKIKNLRSYVDRTIEAGVLDNLRAQASGTYLSPYVRWDEAVGDGEFRLKPCKV